MKTLDELFAEEEAKRLPIVKAEMAAERAAYDALPQSEKDRLFREAEEKWAAFDASCEDTDDEEDEEDDDE